MKWKSYLSVVSDIVDVRFETHERALRNTVSGSSCGTAKGRDALEGGEVDPTPLQGAQPMPSHCLPDAKCHLQWHL